MRPASARLSKRRKTSCPSATKTPFIARIGERSIGQSLIGLTRASDIAASRTGTIGQDEGADRRNPEALFVPPTTSFASVASSRKRTSSACRWVPVFSKMQESCVFAVASEMAEIESPELAADAAWPRTHGSAHPSLFPLGPSPMQIFPCRRSPSVRRAKADPFVLDLIEMDR